MIYVYIVVSAALVPILNNFFDILRQPYSWWLTPLLVIAFVLGFILIQMAVFGATIQFTNLSKSPDKGAKFFRFMVKHSLPIIVKLARVKINTTLKKELPEDTRLLLVCNHQHDFDPVIIYSVFPDAELAFIGKKEIYQTMPFVAKAMHRMHCLPIDRENDREAAKTIVQAIKYIKEDKVSIALFPEGYCSKNCELLPLRNGSLKIAMKANVPIAVCVINNTQEIPKNMFRRKTEVDFRLIDIITPEQFADMNTVELGGVIYEKMNTELKEMRDK